MGEKQPETAIQPSIRMTEVSQGLMIEMPAGSSLFGMFLMGLAAMFACMLLLIGPLFFAGGIDLSVIAFLAVAVLLVPVTGAVGLLGAYFTLGRETLVVSPARLHVRRSLFGRGTWRAYDVPRIRNLRVERDTFTPDMLNLGRAIVAHGLGYIAMEYPPTGTYRFGFGVSGHDAKQVVAAIRRRIAEGQIGQTAPAGGQPAPAAAAG